MKRLCLYIGILVLASASLYSIYLNCSLSKKVKSLEARLQKAAVLQGGLGASGVGEDAVDIDPYKQIHSKDTYLIHESKLTELGLFQGDWDRELDYGTGATGEEEEGFGNGCTLLVCCGAALFGGIPQHPEIDPSQRLIFRQMTIDKNGCIRKISKAKYALWIDWEELIK